MNLHAKILILDDDEDLLEMVSLLLTKKQFIVTAIKDWKKIYDTINMVKPDIILMDIYLGNTDGRKLCRELKKDNSLTTPIILYSAGHILPESIIESQASDFIIKPFDIDFLVQKIYSFLPIGIK